MEPRTAQDKAKYAAGKTVVTNHIRSGMKLGLGSGTTSHWFVQALGEAVSAGLDVVGVPTSTGTRQLAKKVGIPLADLDETGHLDLAIDGADEIDHDGAMIKGGGACLLWERIVANAAERFIAVVDDSKLVDTLGSYPLPIEVIPFGWKTTRNAVERLLNDAGYPQPRLSRRESHKGRPVETDSGNYILDARLGHIHDKKWLDKALNWIPGVVENGLFTGVADTCVLAHPDGGTEVRELPRTAPARDLPH